MRMRALPLVFGLLALAALPISLRADELRGAAAALERLKAPTAAGQSEVSLRHDLEEFTKAARGMPPGDAARSWLGLFDRLSALTQEADRAEAMAGRAPLQVEELVQALPPPAAWPTIADGLDSRAHVPHPGLRERAWSLLAALLRGTPNGTYNAAVSLRDAASHSSAQYRQFFEPAAVSILRQVAEQSGTPAQVLSAVEQEVSVAATAHQPQVEVPNLVELVGEPAATAALTRILTTVPAQLAPPPGSATARLATRLALQLLPRLRSPQWGLTQSRDGAELYQALEKRFPPMPVTKPDSPSVELRDLARGSARYYHMLSLLAAGRARDAAALAPGLRGALESDTGSLQETGWEMERNGHGDALEEFYRQVLTSSPDLPCWDAYISVSTHRGHRERAVAFLKETIEKNRVAVATRTTLRASLFRADLAMDRIDDAVTVLRTLLGTPASREEQQMNPGGPMEWAIALARIGRLTGHADWVDEGVRAIQSQLKSRNGTSALQATDLLFDLGRGPEAEQALLAEVVTLQSTMPQAPPESTNAYLVALAALYHRAGRPADVKTLLDHAPGWGAKDLSEILLLADSSDLPLGYLAASSVAQTGEPDRAVPLLHALLRERTSFDPAYELLVRLEGEKALPFLEELARHDPLESRPLVWKADSLRRAGRLPDAERSIRAALALDPSDALQKAGRRGRAYLVLSEIHQAQSQADRAREDRDRVAATRLGEEADALAEAGLTERAVRKYSEAIGHSPNCYWLEARLALCLEEQGHTTESEPHFRRALQLLPEGLGRGGTFYPGTEGVFHDPICRRLADEILPDMARRQPDRAEVQHALGLLREQETRLEDALVAYRAAVAHDAEFYGGWLGIQRIHAQRPVSAKELNQSGLAVLRLDPPLRHLQATALQVPDLRALWTAAAAAQQDRPEAARALYPLRDEAPAAAVPEPEQMALFRMRRQFRFGGAQFFGEVGIAMENRTPGQLLAGQPLLEALGQMLSQERSTRQQMAPGAG